MSEDKKEENKLNKNAKEYIPTKNRIPEKLNLNLNAKEYQPKEKQKNIELDEDDDEEVDKKIDMIANDMVENDLIEEQAKANDSDEEDENKFYPKYKNCQCCKGYVYKCNGDTCKSLGQCYCKMSDDCELEH